MNEEFVNMNRLYMLREKIRSLTQEQYAVLVLIAASLLSLVIYWLAFVRPFELHAMQFRAQLDIQRIAAADASARWMQLIAFVELGVIYWVTYRAVRNVRGRAAWLTMIAGSMAFSVLLLFLFPFDADDIFDNIMHGRILGVYNANPFLRVISEYPRDPFRPYVGWPNTPSAYGPLWEILAGLTARLAGNGIVQNVVAFKLLGGLFLAGSVALVADILRRLAPERALAGALVLAWNPVVLFVTMGNGHNDIAMVFWMLLAAWLLIRRHYTLAILALVAGGLVKFIPVLAIPAAGLIALRDLPDTRARARFVVATGLAALALGVAVYAPFWHGLDTLGIDRRQKLFTTSLPAFLWAWLQEPLGNERAALVVSRAGAIFTVAFALAMGVRAWFDRSWESFTRSAFYTMMFYLLVTGPWFQNWYSVWPLALASLLPYGRAFLLAHIFTFATVSKPYIFAPLFLWRTPFPPDWWRELRLGPTVMALPWIYSLYSLGAALAEKVSARRRSTPAAAQVKSEAPDRSM